MQQEEEKSTSACVKEYTCLFPYITPHSQESPRQKTVFPHSIALIIILNETLLFLSSHDTGVMTPPPPPPTPNTVRHLLVLCLFTCQYEYPYGNTCSEFPSGVGGGGWGGSQTYLCRTPYGRSWCLKVGLSAHISQTVASDLTATPNLLTPGRPPSVNKFSSGLRDKETPSLTVLASFPFFTCCAGGGWWVYYITG